MLECKNISLKAGDKALFTASELLLNAGLYALVGRNGTGKSTFLRTIAGELSTDGTILLNGNNIEEIGLKQMAFQISIVKSRAQLFGDFNVRNILMLGRLPYQKMLAIPSKEDNQKVDKVANDLGLVDLLEKNYNLLSDGEKQMVMVARAFVQDTPVILLDEPAAFLDLVNRKELLDHLKRLAAQENKLIIFATHHIEVLPNYCDGVMLIHNKKLSLLKDKSKFVDTINQAFELN
ncbi:ABC transporter ATP-binding protein [Paracrocinitomix mangrovi]|uniref:ABC transporter ATP-binding protein n=1 Tax=Paracrocinitomix mangrovi TaxID=2862509 RepID=UPI001C8D8A9E|nr:ABC transporter ATP-binding protein [Paracrocinitomix mangrovi]UKN01819.1 ABC transporter ATP-binding protein [Paracrocinitomix mangrovi]